MSKFSFLVVGLCLATIGGANWQTPKPETVIPAIDEAPTRDHAYNWMDRHNAEVKRAALGNVDLLLVGDSITHGFGGPPDSVRGDPVGALWTKYLGSRNALNEGFGYDRTQHVLWRFDHGEVDGISPKVAIVLIGTNNIGTNNTADVVAGITAVVDELQLKLAKTKILLLGIFPRDQQPDTPNRKEIGEVNQLVETTLGKRDGVTYLDLTSTFLQPDSTISKEVMGDYLHPTAKGYDMWLKAMEPTLANLMGDSPRS